MRYFHGDTRRGAYHKRRIWNPQASQIPASGRTELLHSGHWFCTFTLFRRRVPKTTLLWLYAP
jgi:hypothetical protein